MLELLTGADHAEADRLAAAAGVPGGVLMETAGAAVAAETARRWAARPALILCGPGNNGGDGFVVARLLADAGWPVRVALVGGRDSLRGDAAAMASRWQAGVEPLSPAALDGAELVVDALFGAGLARPLAGVAAETARAVADRGIPAVAVDLPSGVFGDSGAASDAVAPAALTVTFLRKKPAHVLFPGRRLCGEVIVAGIGHPEAALAGLAPAAFENAPPLWSAAYPWPDPESHKYARGHAVVVGGGPASTGAGRMAAAGALRVGSGLVTVACPPRAMAVNAAHLTEILLEMFESAADLGALLGRRKRKAVLLGPGAGATPETREHVRAALALGVPCVLDADALTAFESEPAGLFDVLGRRCVLTPHDGEFARLFPAAVERVGRLARARAAAEASGAVVLSKGPDTVIAAPGGLAAVNANAPPELATAGSGDVLSGFVLGLLAQGVPPFEAAAAAVWLHGAAAARFGPGLVAGDLPHLLPPVLRDLQRDAAPRR